MYLVRIQSTNWGYYFLRLLVETGPPFYVVIVPSEGLAICRAKAVLLVPLPSFLSYFKTLSIVPVPGIEPATSRSAVKRSTD